MTDTAAFTRTAARMVRRNDHSLRGVLARAARRAGALWGGLALSAVVVYNVPPYSRFYG